MNIDKNTIAVETAVENAKLKIRVERLETENAELRAENNNMRYLLARLAPECIHCGLANPSECAAGFPGCGLADDLNFETPELKAIAENWRSKLRAENERLKIALADTVAVRLA